MGVKYMRDGEDFHFDKDFGFTKSANAGMTSDSSPRGMYVDGVKELKARGGHSRKKKMSLGGPSSPFGPGMGGGIDPIVPPPTQPPMGGGIDPIRAPGTPNPQAFAHANPQANFLRPPMPATQPPATSPRPYMNTPTFPAGIGGQPPSWASEIGSSQIPAQPPTMLAKGGKFIQKGIKHPGRMKKLAARHGVSLGEEISKDKHSKDPSLRAAANLGARFRSGEFRHGKKG